MSISCQGFSVKSGLVSTVVKSDVAGSMMVEVFKGLMSVVVWCCCEVWLLVLNAESIQIGGCEHHDCGLAIIW